MKGKCRMSRYTLSCYRVISTTLVCSLALTTTNTVAAGRRAFQEPNQQSRVQPLIKQQDLEPGFVEGSSLLLKPRSYYLNRNRDTNPDTAGWALGGALQYRSGYWQQWLRLGATLFTSQKLYGPDDKDGTQLFEPGQEPFTVVGEAFIAARFAENTGVRLGRQRFELPYLGSHDIRMVPNTFEAIAVGNTSPVGLAYMAGYVDRIKRKNDDQFIDMAEAAGADSDDGVVFAGARYILGTNQFGGIYQRTPDVFDTVFVKFEHHLPVSDQLPMKAFLQYTDQRSIGDKLIGDFDTYLLAGKLELTTGPVTWRLAASTTDEESGIQKPYGNPANYLSVIVEDFDRAGEDAWMVGMSYDFKRVGIGDLSTFINIVDGNTPDSGANASPDQTEYDITVDYRMKEGWSDRLWLRVRAAYVDQEEELGGNDFLDFRIIVNYDLELL